jgi:hypothetical protein
VLYGAASTTGSLGQSAESKSVYKIVKHVV